MRLFKGVKGIIILLLLPLFSQTACSQTSGNKIRDLGNGFLDHGVAVPIATSRGTVATVDDKGYNVILAWLSDHRGTYSLLMIDTDRETSKQFFLPFTGHSYTSILSSQNRYYTHFNGRFIEFDPSSRTFTFIGKTSPGSAMSMTEDDEGVIWAALMPDCSLISYNPKTKKLTNYGVIYHQKARQKPRSIATDDTGWIYITAGSPGKEQIIAFNPKTRKTKLTQKKTELTSKDLSIFKNQNGEIYSQSGEKVMTKLYKGSEKSIKGEGENNKTTKIYTAGNQALFKRTFPDGKRIGDWISAVNAGFLGSRKVTINDQKTGKKRKITFDYKTEGASLMGVAASPNGTIVGGSNFPMFFFQYDPNKGKWTQNHAFGQFNTLATQSGKFFIGVYPHGDLIKWDPDQKWVPTRKENRKTNPQYLAGAEPYIHRPNDLLIYPNDSTIIMAGRPSNTRTAGGLLFWDRRTQTADVLKQIKELQNQSTYSLVALPGGKILGGTTITPGDKGGERLAKEAELYVMDIRSRKVEWSRAMIPGANSYQDLCVAPNGLVLGVTGGDQFFIFDPKAYKILRQVNLQKAFGSEIPYTQGQRSFVRGSNDEIYLLLRTGILQIDPDSFEMTLLAESPAKITGGGAYLNGRIYYVSGNRSRIHSYTLPNRN